MVVALAIADTVGGRFLTFTFFEYVVPPPKASETIPWTVMAPETIGDGHVLSVGVPASPGCRPAPWPQSNWYVNPAARLAGPALIAVNASTYGLPSTGAAAVRVAVGAESTTSNESVC